MGVLGFKFGGYYFCLDLLIEEGKIEVKKVLIYLVRYWKVCEGFIKKKLKESENIIDDYVLVF